MFWNKSSKNTYCLDNFCLPILMWSFLLSSTLLIYVWFMSPVWTCKPYGFMDLKLLSSIYVLWNWEEYIYSRIFSLKHKNCQILGIFFWHNARQICRKGGRRFFRRAELPTLVTDPPTSGDNSYRMESFQNVLLHWTCWMFLSPLKYVLTVFCNIVCNPTTRDKSYRKEVGAVFLSDSLKTKDQRLLDHQHRIGGTDKPSVLIQHCWTSIWKHWKHNRHC